MADHLLQQQQQPQAAGRPAAAAAAGGAFVGQLLLAGSGGSSKRARPGAQRRVIVHIDMDCFFAAVATVGRPEFAGGWKGDLHCVGESFVHVWMPGCGPSVSFAKLTLTYLANTGTLTS